MVTQSMVAERKREVRGRKGPGLKHTIQSERQREDREGQRRTGKPLWVNVLEPWRHQRG